MTMTLFNTLTHRKEEFIPLHPPKVQMYCCGPTVYNYAHIGNLRTYVFEDVLRRLLRFNGYQVHHVMNITDVGHMTSDSDAGDDKMEKAAREQQKSPWELAKFYEDAFIKDISRLNIEKPETTPKATDHVVDMIELIKKLEERGYTYVTSEGVYFDTSRDATYGDMARLRLLDQKQGAREEVVADTTKRNPSDFVLWFLNKPTHIMQWTSPWGTGYPGWHIECSAMSMRYLGETLDIHCGGVDHIPVHHTNEIAQSECATGHPFVRYWVHGEFLLMEKQKMSKSKGGSINTLQSLIDAGYDPIAYRYLCLQAHYRSELNFSDTSLAAAATGLRKVYSLTAENDPLNENDQAYEAAVARVTEVLNDDIGTPAAIGLLNAQNSRRLWLHFDSVLGLDIEKQSNRPEEPIPDEVQQLIGMRNTARVEKRWKESDEFRERIEALGYEVRDGAGGTTVTQRAG